MSNQENNEDKKWEAPASMGDDFDFLEAYGAVEEVKNDDQLVKMAGIVQRLISAENRGGVEDEYGLSDDEKQQLLSGIETTIKDIQIESDKIHNKIEIVKKGN